MALTFGNLPGNDGGAALISSVQFGQGFTTDGNSYTIDSVDLRLRDYNLGDIPLIEIRDNNAGIPGAAVIGSFNNPAPQGSGNFTYNFTPSSGITLAPNTTYWLLVDVTSGDYRWLRNNPFITPTTTFASYVSTQSSSDNGASYTPFSQIYSFQINATQVTPIPFRGKGTVGICLLASGVAVNAIWRYWGRRKKDDLIK